MQLLYLIKRNMQLYFKDKGMFFTSLITPIILLVLYTTFLYKIFKDSFLMNCPAELGVPEDLIDGLVGGQLLSSILAVSCVTIAFCTNLIMIQDKYNEAIKDLTVAPIRRSVLALSYFIASLLSTLLVCYVTTGLSFIYLAINGWYLTVADVFLILLDVFLLALFGTSLSSIIHFFLKTQGQMSAVGTIVSSVYGFICGAYMPIANFPLGLQRALLFLPGTYGTSLLKNHAMGSAINKLADYNVPDEALDGIRSSVDCNIEFFDRTVSIGAMYGVIIASTIIFIGIYILLNALKKKNIK